MAAARGTTEEIKEIEHCQMMMLARRRSPESKSTHCTFCLNSFSDYLNHIGLLLHGFMLLLAEKDGEIMFSFGRINCTDITLLRALKSHS
jgi:hypothetical protein